MPVLQMLNVSQGDSMTLRPDKSRFFIRYYMEKPEGMLAVFFS